MHINQKDMNQKPEISFSEQTAAVGRTTPRMTLTVIPVNDHTGNYNYKISMSK